MEPWLLVLASGDAKQANAMADVLGVPVQAVRSGLHFGVPAAFALSKDHAVLTALCAQLRGLGAHAFLLQPARALEPHGVRVVRHVQQEDGVLEVTGLDGSVSRHRLAGLRDAVAFTLRHHVAHQVRYDPTTSAEAAGWLAAQFALGAVDPFPESSAVENVVDLHDDAVLAVRSEDPAPCVLVFSQATLRRTRVEGPPATTSVAKLQAISALVAHAAGTPVASLGTLRVERFVAPEPWRARAGVAIPVLCCLAAQTRRLGLMEAPAVPPPATVDAGAPRAPAPPRLPVASVVAAQPVDAPAVRVRTYSPLLHALMWLAMAVPLFFLVTELMDLVRHPTVGGLTWAVFFGFGLERAVRATVRYGRPDR